MDIVDVLISVTAFLCLLVGLFFRWHKNHAIFIFSCLIVISNIINPFLFMANEDMYAYAGWSAVRSFNFTVESLIHSYTSSNFIYSLIVFFSLPLLFLSRSKVVSSTTSNSSVSHSNTFIGRIREKSFEKYLIFICMLLMVIYYPLYNNQIGVTGLPGELPYHLSGVVHYIRAYLIPILLVILLSQAGGGSKVILFVLIYAFVAGIAAASRFVGLLPVVLLIMYFVRIKKYSVVALCSIYSLFIWFAISASRDLTFDGEAHDLVEVAYYSLTNISLDDMVNTLDLLTGRISGAQQIVLVHQFRGHEGCDNIVNFLFGIGDICSDTAGIIYGLDLSGTSYGLGLSLIPSIVVSGGSLLDYFFPAVLVSCLIWLSQFFYQRLNLRLGWHGIAGLYLFLSILFIYLGQMLFFFYLQYVIISILIGKSLLKRLRFGFRFKLYA